jgi:hypothetical protein
VAKEFVARIAASKAESQKIARPRKTVKA